MIELASLKDSIWDSIKETFETMISLPIENLDTDTEQEKLISPVICTITFTNDINGSLSILCAYKTAEKITKAMLMMESNEDIDEPGVHDALGEVTNMVLGGLKTRLADTASDIQISIPTVIKGTEIFPRIGKGVENVAITTAIDGDILKIIVKIRPK
ncbi:MAG: chemotaxis protein CheX [Planctomycetes bacterium]|nr:chemotaxis protein CheX [Planctomycetota bacterium]